MIRRNRDQARLTADGRRLRDSARRGGEAPAQGQPYAPAASGTASVAARRRGPSIKAVLLIALLLILSAALVGGILLWQRVSKFNASVSTAPAASSALWGPLGGTDRINIALFGYGGKEHKSGNYLADSIQILSIDPVGKTTTIIPIPRDLWIEGFSQLPDNGKINEAFAIGWTKGGIPEAAQVTSKVLTQVTGLEIHHWMAIDFSGFKAVIDAVGGITVRNPTTFRYTWNPWKYDHGVWDHRFKRGLLTLTGEEALDYARARYTNLPQESSDFARSIRQERVLKALRTKLGTGGIGSIGSGFAMMDALSGELKTDLSAIDLFLLSSHINPDARIELKEGRILEATTNSIGQYILVVKGRRSSTDYAPLQQYLRRQLAKPIPTATPRARSSRH